MTDVTEQLDLAGYQADDDRDDWTWQCSCGKSGVFGVEKTRARSRAKGHEINCKFNGETRLTITDE